jgi:selT/selW/selH-like putative selenoprotein
LEADLKLHFKTLQIKLISSGGGVFEVKLGSELIFSKKSSGRFPINSEIIDLIEKKLV